jgi:hypothetical protein
LEFTFYSVIIEIHDFVFVKSEIGNGLPAVPAELQVLQYTYNMVCELFLRMICKQLSTIKFIILLVNGNKG